MIKIDKQSRVPIYEQLIEQVEQLVLSSILEADMLIPSVRSLSLELSVNPNTIQKAYNELELRGITYSVPGVGRFVSKNAIEILKKDKLQSFEKLRATVEDLKLSGVALETVIDKIKEYYGGNDND
ncbi:MAG: GntR family transcriptional regulator [Ruminococcaceae bacterium]|nr:GntR family transcriptional regulator [Oscillospiraceae bacterium]